MPLSLLTTAVTNICYSVYITLITCCIFWILPSSLINVCFIYIGVFIIFYCYFTYYVILFIIVWVYCGTYAVIPVTTVYDYDDTIGVGVNGCYNFIYCTTYDGYCLVVYVVDYVVVYVVVDYVVYYLIVIG